MDFNKIKQDFPIFKNNHTLVYLDSAATSQKPQIVLDSMDEFYSNYNSNVHRGVYKISEEATEKYEKTRETIQSFINAKSEKEIIYTRGTTESLNLIMRAYGEKFVKQGDKIVISIMEHHSNFVPWQELAKRKNAKLEIIDINENYELKEDEIKTKLKGAKLISISHASNVLGTLNQVNEICKIAREQGAISIVDAAQSIPHMKVNVQKIGCDFLAFSGHKMLGPTGIGVLYGKEELLEKMDPFLFGGEMISEVKPDKSEWNVLPYKFEAGTLPIAEVIGLGSAIDYLNKIGMDNIENHEKDLTKYAMENLAEIKNLEIYGPKNFGNKLGVLAFNIHGIHSHDTASILNEYNIAIRTGHHCAMPLHERLGLGATARASFYIYNDKKNIDKLISAIKEAKKIFKVN